MDGILGNLSNITEVVVGRGGPATEAELDFDMGPIVSPADVFLFLSAREKFRRWQICRYSGGEDCNRYELSLSQGTSLINGLKWMPDGEARETLREGIEDSSFWVSEESTPLKVTWDTKFGGGIALFMPEENTTVASGVAHFGTGPSLGGILGLEAFFDIFPTGYFRDYKIVRFEDNKLYKVTGDKVGVNLGLGLQLYMLTASARYELGRGSFIYSGGIDVPMYGMLAEDAGDNERRFLNLGLQLEGFTDLNRFSGAMAMLTLTDENPL